MKSVKELKAQTNERFIGCCGENAVIFLITAAVFAFMILLWMTFTEIAEKSSLPPNVFGGITIIFTQIILILLVMSLTPFLYGVKWYRIQQIRGNDVPGESIFRCYTSVKRISALFKFSLAISVKRMKFLAPMAVMLGTAAYFTVQFRKTGGWAAFVSSAIMLVLIIIAYFTVVILNCKYAAAGFLFVLDPEKSPEELIRRSEEISGGRTGYIIRSMMSVSWWVLSFVFVFPAIFALPYMEMMYAAVINEIIEADGKENSASGKENEESLGKEYSRG